MKTINTLLIFIAFSITVMAQAGLERELTGYKNPEELVSLSQNIPFNQAIEVLSTVSEKLTGKKIVTTAPISDPIGIEITNMQYWKALILITQYANLMYEERENVIVVKRKDEDNASNLPEAVYADIDSREVNIAAVIFEANISEMKEEGINWELLFEQSGISLGSSLLSFSEGDDDESSSSSSSESSATSEFLLSGQSEFTTGNWEGSATAAFKYFETNGLGEIISRPTVTVRDKMKGRIQIGSDISIKQRDFAGNVIDVFYSTGTIIEVTPYIYEQDGLTYILLKLDVERSSANPGELSTEITKTKATTEVLMLDGEQTTIGGLLVNEEVEERRGIPILKDLPWWVFGIRYLTGYTEISTVQKEVIILIEADLVDRLKDRISDLRQNKYFETKQQNFDALKRYLNQRSEFNKQNKENPSDVIKGDDEE